MAFSFKALTTPAERVRRMFAERDGSIGVHFALTLPVIAFVAWASIDYANLISEKSRLQSIADIAGARELRMSNTNSSTISAIAQNVVNANLSGSPLATATTTSVDILDNGKSIKVSLTHSEISLMGTLISSAPKQISVSATARMVGSSPICVVAIAPSGSKTLQLDKDARVSAVGCAIYSNSTDANAISTKNSATVTASLICSAGGAVGNSSGLNPQPQTDCPQIPDPLGSRPMPTVGSCTQTSLVISGGTQSLNPGVYCGGLRITGGAVVTVNPGTFIIKDGPLRVDGDSSMTGANVGFFLTGAGAQLNFDSGMNTISLTAPVSGELAGILFFEDRSAANGQNHQILSDNARVLLGTIYLPRGNFYVASNAPVADQSAYTILVTNTLQLSAGPNLVLNSNYGLTDIPVPEGVGPGAAVLQN